MDESNMREWDRNRIESRHASSSSDTEQLKEASPEPHRPSSFVQAIERIVKTHQGKARDYTSTTGEYNNFEMAAREANISTEQFLEGMIANKNERRKSLEYGPNKPNYESLEDTLLDRAVFAIIRYAHYLDQRGANDPRVTRVKN